jgi:hypothetical protein
MRFLQKLKEIIDSQKDFFEKIDEARCAKSEFEIYKGEWFNISMYHLN